MIITFEELLNDKSWLNACLSQSLTGEVITDATEKQQFDVKLLVNGVELEPKLLDKMITNVASYIDKQAYSLIKEKYEAIEDEMSKLQSIVSEASNTIIDKFDGDYEK